MGVHVLIVGLLVVVWLLWAWRVLAIFRRRAFVFSFALEVMTAVTVTAALAGVAIIEIKGWGGMAGAWLQVGLCVFVITLFVVRYVHMFRSGRVVLSYRLDFTKYVLAFFALEFVLILLAARLFAQNAFAGLAAGIVGIVLPLSSLAFVIQEIMDRFPSDQDQT